MLSVSFDPDAGSIYWYFVEIDEGSTALEGECDGALLLDADGQVIGVELELDESITRADLAHALAQPGVRYDPDALALTALLFDEEPATVQPLSEPAILDFDSAERLQGCELVPAPEFELATRLDRLRPFLVDADEPEPADQPPAPPPPITLPATPIPGFRSGFVALVGRPNVGKSTLLNALLGQKVAIVSPKPQTTRTAVRGILHRPDAQVVFVDTPGIHEPRNRLGSFMVEQARRAIPDADVVCFVVDISAPVRQLDERIATLVRRSRARKLLVLNKVDLPNPHGMQHVDAYRALAPWDMEVAVSALRGEGLETFVDQIVRLLPEATPLYPEDQVTDQSEREHVAELVREQVLRHIQDEVPHGVAVEVEEWEEKEHALYIRLTIVVERESQKGIVIGANGSMLKKIGSAARRNAETALGRKVFLDLWVKARGNWRDDPSALHWLGYRES